MLPRVRLRKIRIRWSGAVQQLEASAANVDQDRPSGAAQLLPEALHDVVVDDIAI